MARGRDRPDSRRGDRDPALTCLDDGTTGTPPGSGADAAGPWYRARMPPGLAGAGPARRPGNQGCGPEIGVYVSRTSALPVGT
jgi:hypothetical protein